MTSTQKTDFFAPPAPPVHMRPHGLGLEVRVRVRVKVGLGLELAPWIRPDPRIHSHHKHVNYYRLTNTTLAVRHCICIQQSQWAASA